MAPLRFVVVLITNGCSLLSAAMALCFAPGPVSSTKQRRQHKPGDHDYALAFEN